MMGARGPISARWAATLITVVVLPTPPFWLATARTSGGMAAIMRRRDGAEPGAGAGEVGVACFTVMFPVEPVAPVRCCFTVMIPVKPDTLRRGGPPRCAVRRPHRGLSARPARRGGTLRRCRAPAADHPADARPPRE